MYAAEVLIEDDEVSADLWKLVGPDEPDTLETSSTKLTMFSRLQLQPSYKDKSFLQEKYVQNRLSPAQIARLTFSSRQSIMKYLRTFEIPLRPEDSRISKALPFGMKRVGLKVVASRGELAAISLMRALRARGLSYDDTASELNKRRVQTKRANAKWYASSVRKVLMRPTIKEAREI